MLTWIANTIGTPLGFEHFHHLAPQPAGHRWPYPDCLRPVYLARAAVFLPAALLPNEYEPDAFMFHPIREVLTLAVPAIQRCFLDTVLHRRGRGA